MVAAESILKGTLARVGIVVHWEYTWLNCQRSWSVTQELIITEFKYLLFPIVTMSLLVLFMVWSASSSPPLY